jgi:hypothetical protein
LTAYTASSATRITASSDLGGLKKLAVNTNGVKIALIFLIVAGTLPAIAQQRPSSTVKRPPDPVPNHVNVRFAMGKQPVTRRHFRLTAKAAGRTILAGSFASGFSIPSAALTNNDMLEIEIKCGEHHWHFSDVGPRALRQGWQWVGTDYPLFQEMLLRDETFKDELWV